MKLLRRAAFILMALMSQAQAQGLVLPGGLAVDPARSLDLTYQVIPDYDPNEKVIAGWAGDKLQYFVTVEKLPAGWLDADKYFQAFLRDMRAADRSVDTGRSGKYKAASSLSGQYLEVLSRSSPQAAPTTQAVHFITDGKLAFLGIASLTKNGTADRMLEETRLLFQSSSLPGAAPAPTAPVAPVVKAESPYVGSWKWSGTAPNGRPAVSRMSLRNDLSFSTDLTVDGKVVFRATGVWSVSGKRVLWVYLRSEPALPQDKRQDEDEIVSLDKGRLVLRSRLSGKDREFLQQ